MVSRRRAEEGMWANVAVQRDEGEALLAARGVAIRGRLGMGTR